MNKFRQSIEILYRALNYEICNGRFNKRLVIIEARDTALNGRIMGPYVSVMDLTSEDFLALYRYKKNLEEEETKDKKGEN